MKTLLDHGLDMEKYRENTWDERGNHRGSILPSTADLRKETALGEFDISGDLYNVGMSLGNLSKCFGAMAIGFKLPWQIFRDCWRHVGLEFSDECFSCCSYDSGHKYIDTDDWLTIQEGFEFVLYELWLPTMMR